MSADQDTSRWDAILAEGPTTVIERILRETRGVVDDDQRADLEAAATMACSLQLVAAGARLDDVERQFTERDHSFHFSLTDDELEVTVEWHDEEVDDV